MKLLITGATGFIGQDLVPFLAARRQYQITILVREAYSQPNLLPLPPRLLAIREKIDVAYADLRNYAQTKRAVRAAAPETVIHLAAGGVRDPFLSPNTALRHNLHGTLHLLRACFMPGNHVQQCIIARTVGELSKMNVYAASKAAAWGFCEMYGRTHQWPIHGALIFQAYGPHQSAQNFIPAAVRAACSGQDFPMTAGDQSRDWIYISDVVEGLARMIAAKLLPATTVELGSGQTYSLKTVAEMIYQFVGYGGRPLIGSLPTRPGEALLQKANADQTWAQIGWRSSVSLSAGVRNMVAAFDPQGAG